MCNHVWSHRSVKPGLVRPLLGRVTTLPSAKDVFGRNRRIAGYHERFTGDEVLKDAARRLSAGAGGCLSMSKIEWTDETWNPVTGCTRVSPGCDHCYMYRLYPRLKAMGVPGYDKSPDEVTLMRERLVQPYRWRKPRRVFVNSMSDLFHSDVPTSFIDNIFVVMEQNPQHQFQILTKRPKSAVHWWRRQTHCREWPPNAWMGTSVESEEYMDRIKQIMKLPAKVRFVSAEPLLGPLPSLRCLSKYWVDSLGDHRWGERAWGQGDGGGVGEGD